MKNLLLIILFFTGNIIYSQSCSVNAGGNATICGTAYTLQGSVGANSTGIPTWTLMSKPPGAPDPIIAGINTLTPNVTGMTFPGNYVFQVSQPCTTGTSTSQVTITAPGEVSTFTAGPDITTVSALTGVATLNATVPNGYTASWTYYNLNSFEFNSTVTTQNATMTGTTTATPTLTLTKKADHDIDPAYRAVLRITSTNNPSCWYEDDAIVRFRPNPNVSYPNVRSQCVSASTVAANRYYYDPNSSSPLFSDDTTNASANPSFGTTITMTVISQPSGGNLAYGRMNNGRIFFASSFNQIPGAYVFTITITNASGTYTTQQLTYNYTGTQPNQVSFLDPAHPEQMMFYGSGGSGGSVYCNRAGTNTPITFYFKLNPADSPALTSTVTANSIIPAGGAPSIAYGGLGTMNRSVTLTPPSGGWRVGTYRLNVSTGNGTCTTTQSYYVHISDGLRPNVQVNNITICYSGSGVVSATVPLPDIYKGVVSPSYFQDFSGRYDLSVVSSPAGSATPIFDPNNLRTITNTSTVIGNLNMSGEYVFRIKAVPNGGGIDPGFLEQEYACSGTSLESTFSIFISGQINANAGSNISITCPVGAVIPFNGNNPGVASSGAWTLVSKPAGAVDPTIANPTLYNSNVTGFTFAGTYKFRWTITTGTCVSSSDVDVIVTTTNCPSPGGVATGLSYWYRADKNATNTGATTDVTEWTDMWNGITVKQMGTNTLPKYTVGTSAYFNFNPGINFTATTQSLGNISVQTLTSLNYDIFTFTKEGMSGTRFFNIGRNNTTFNGSNWDSPAFEPGGNIVRRNNAGGGPVYWNNPGNTFVTGIPSISYTTFTDVNLKRGVNGSSLLGPASNHGAIGAVTGGHIFGRNSGTLAQGDDAGFIGHIGETIIYGAGTLSNTERRRVDSYLAIKYGITLGQVSTDHYLDTDGNIVWNGASNTVYNNNIFGVSRDDKEVFEQKVSKSVNAGTILTVATINDFVNPNQAAARTGFTNDKTYFLLGDNNIVATPLVNITVAGNTLNRIQRTWLSQRKNTTDALYFEADLAAYGTSFSVGNNILMVIADDAAFTTNVKTVPGTFSSGKWIFSNDFNVEGIQRYITFAKSVIIADLAVTKTDGTSNYIPGTDVIYTVTVVNNGPSAVTGVTVADPVPSGIPVSNVSYTAVTSSGSSTNVVGTQTGAINDIVSLPVNGTVTYTVIVSVPSSFTGNLVNTVTINPPVGISDSNTSNNTATDTNTSQPVCPAANAIAAYFGDSSANPYGSDVSSFGTNIFSGYYSVSNIGGTTNGTAPTSGTFNGTQVNATTTYFNISGVGATFAANKYASFDVSVHANSPRMDFNRLDIKAMQAANAVNQGRFNYNGRLAIVDIATGIETILVNTQLVTQNYTNFFPASSYKMEPGKSYQVRLYVHNNGNGYSNVYMDNPTLYIEPVPNISTPSQICLSSLTGTVKNALAPYLLSPSTISNIEIRWLKNGVNVTNSAITSGIFVPLYYNTTSNCYITPAGDPVTVSDCAASYCYKPGITDAVSTYPTKHGITALSRAGADNDNWPMARQSAWTVLESKEKGFVVNRVATTAGLANITNPVEGMMVYDEQADCLKIYTLKSGESTMAWHCFVTPACPD